ncbi:MAG TPA: L-threonylcarbamoyladenylate synthase [Candidatus Omnitrophota bacterium]|nr:L-threonylcarbamoyladenylate synthase [Candidatus Omnitrophota bacterium]HPS19657.1 L-threonylcarbamoyladenylate synthase [Candidatus Omnitrophota bacterium]
MKPRIVKVDPLNVDRIVLKDAAEIINNRGLVAFPTETVYGLGASALDPKAASRIFEAKKRPLDDPLIVHIADKKDLALLAKDIPAAAEKVIESFWPGPLTVILKKTEKVPDIVTAGLDTVAVRMPSNPVIRELIKAAGVPIAAPSANLFGKASPTTAQHVIDDLGESVDMVLDGGSTDIGIESTVIEFDGDKAVILRPGGVSVEDIRPIVREVVVGTGEGSEKTPGKYSKHYAPKANVVIVSNVKEQTEKVLSIADNLTKQGRKVGIFARQEHEAAYTGRGYIVRVLGPGDEPKICAARLFQELREFDKENVDMIVAEAIEEKGIGLGVMNRLKKAAGPDLWTNIEAQ